MTANITHNDNPITVEFNYLGDGRPPFLNDEVDICEVYFQGVEISDFLSMDVVKQIEDSVIAWLQGERLAEAGVSSLRGMIDGFFEVRKAA